MEALTTYSFYTDEYYGDTVEESSFKKWERKAEDKLKYLTYGNITDDSVSEYSDKIQRSVCAIMDMMFEIDKASNEANSKDESNIKSKSSGGESVSYGSTDTVITKAISDINSQNKLLQQTAAEYLSGTGLMYAGY